MGQSSIVRAATAAALALLTTGAEAKESKLFSMTPDDFAAKVRLRDDALEPRAAFDTYNGWREQPTDGFLRAYVDKTTGKTTFQLYETITYFGSWRFYDTINYLTPEGLKEAALIRIDGTPNCGSLAYTSRCQLTEDVAFDVPESLIRQVAGLYQPGVRVSWQYKLKGKSPDGDVRDGIMPAEAAGLLKVIAAYKAAKGLPQ